MLDDVAVFAGALTQAEVQTVMSGDFSSFIGGPPGIVSQPQSLVVAPGTTATFTVGADGAAPFTYQWFFNGTSLGAGAVDATLTLNNVGAGQVGTYWVVVSNSVNAVTSLPVTLSIKEAEQISPIRPALGTTGPSVVIMEIFRPGPPVKQLISAAPCFSPMTG
jgi:hypothetical protein